VEAAIILDRFEQATHFRSEAYMKRKRREEAGGEKGDGEERRKENKTLTKSHRSDCKDPTEVSFSAYS